MNTRRSIQARTVGGSSSTSRPVRVTSHSGEKHERRRTFQGGRRRRRHPRSRSRARNGTPSRLRDHAVIGLSMRPDGGQRTVLFSAGKPLRPGRTGGRYVDVTSFDSTRSGPWLRLKLARMSLDHRISVLNGSVTRRDRSLEIINGTRFGNPSSSSSSSSFFSSSSSERERETEREVD